MVNNPVDTVDNFGTSAAWNRVWSRKYGVLARE